MTRYIAIIPARKNSKRIKQKNLRKIRGKVLVNYTIAAAQKVKKISKIIVTTDIEKLIKKDDSRVIYINRPKELTKDTSTTESAMFHALNYLKSKKKIVSENVILLQPTSPLRNDKDILKAIKKYEKGNHDSLFSAYEDKILIWKKKKNNYEPTNYNFKKRKREQESKRMIIENGAIFIFNYKKFFHYKNRLFGNKGCYIMTRKNSIEIDDDFDLEIANSVKI
jgi:CMP-N,N'-diacetyllegionaminic acid synthase